MGQLPKYFLSTHSVLSTGARQRPTQACNKLSLVGSRTRTMMAHFMLRQRKVCVVYRGGMKQGTSHSLQKDHRRDT